MVTRRPTSPTPAAPVTAERAMRLFRLVTLLGERPRTRQFLTRRLSVGIRDFYRDLEILRRSGVDIVHQDNSYTLLTVFKTAQSLIPFPNPGLTLGEAEQLARGRSAAHRKLQSLVQSLTLVGQPRGRR